MAHGPKPRVAMDASWYMDNPSPEVIERLASERKDHIDRTLKQRTAGIVGVPLVDMLKDVPGQEQRDRNHSSVTAAGGVRSETSMNRPTQSQGRDLVIDLSSPSAK